MTKRSNPAVKAFNAAVADLPKQLAAAHELVQAGMKKAGELTKMAVNKVLDAGRAADVDGGDMRDAIGEIFEAAVEAGQLSKSTARSYLIGVRFAIDRRVAWTTSLHSKEEQVKALQDAGKAIPKSLAEEAAKQASKRDAKASKAHVASKETVVKHLSKALADARTIGAAYAADILDCIHGIQPEWKEPAAGEVAPV